MTKVLGQSTAESVPWTKKDSKASELHPSKKVEWYQPVLKTLPESTVALFVRYAGLESEEAVRGHIYAVRDKAWDILPYPCIGLFRFLDFSIHLSPIYPEVISRVKEGKTLLDLGCCFGQDLRKVAFDAGLSSTNNLIGADIERGFLQLGYELFRDGHSFAARFETGSIFDEAFLADRQGTVDMIYLGSFLHLFNAKQQRTIVVQLNRLLAPGPGSLVFGRHLGADRGGEFRMESLGWDLYRHSDQTIKELWNDAAAGRWDVQSRLTRYESAGWDESRRNWQGDETKQMTFWAKKLNETK